MHKIGLKLEVWNSRVTKWRYEAKLRKMMSQFEFLLTRVTNLKSKNKKLQFQLLT